MSTVIKTNIGNVVKNYCTIKNLINPRTKICVSVKGEAYGHGLEEVSLALSSQQVDYWGVASLSEALAVKNLDIDGKILCYTHFLTHEIEEALTQNIEFLVGDREHLTLVNNIAEKTGVIAHIHLMLETGLGKLGFFPQDIVSAYQFCKSSPHIKIAGFCSHFSNSSDDTIRNKQLAIFNKSIETLQLDSEVLIHIANSGAIIWSPESCSFDMVRPGIMLYGASPNPSRALPPHVSIYPTMQLIGHIVSVQRYPKGQAISYMSTYVCTQDTNIAAINMGYGDGLLRSLSNKGVVSINGKRYPIIGHICMDMCMVNLGDDMASIGDEVVFFGNDVISIDEQATRAETLPHVLSTQITNRAKRIFEY